MDPLSELELSSSSLSTTSNIHAMSSSSSTSITIEYGPLGEPIPLSSLLDENSTYYETLVAGPDGATKHQMWLGWGISFLLISAYATLVLIPIMVTKKTRRSPFNVYLIFLMIPDVLGTLLCGLSCLTNYGMGDYVGGAGHCYFQSFYLIALLSINAWLNAATTRQLLNMLTSAKHFVKYQPPTRRRVSLEAACCYLFGFFTASWGLYRASPHMQWWPHHTLFTYGLLCVPQPLDTPSLLFFYLVYCPWVLGIPFLYVLYACYAIWRHELLPPSGKRRVLAIYFVRLALVFIIMWIPAVFLIFISGGWFSNSWVQWMGGLWGHCQILLSTTLSLMKPDIWKAVSDFYAPLFFCGCGNEEEELNVGDGDSSYYGAASFRSFSQRSSGHGSSLRRKSALQRFSGLGLLGMGRRRSSKKEHKMTSIEMKTWQPSAEDISHSKMASSHVSAPMMIDGDLEDGNNDMDMDNGQQGILIGGVLLSPEDPVPSATDDVDPSDQPKVLQDGRTRLEEKDPTTTQSLGDPLGETPPCRTENFGGVKRSKDDDVPDDFSYSEEDLKGLGGGGGGGNEEDEGALTGTSQRRRRSSVKALFRRSTTSRNHSARLPPSQIFVAEEEENDEENPGQPKDGEGDLA